MINLLKKASLLVWKNKFNQFLLFTLVTLLTVTIIGYYFGTFDQAIHIPFLKKSVNPSLFPNDPFFELKNFHYSYFWLMFQPFLKLNILEISMFIIHLIITYSTYWSIYRISKTLFNNPLTSFLSVITFIFPHIGFAGFPIIEFSLLNRTFVLPFIILTFDFYLNKKYFLTFLILGIMYNFHVVSVNFAMIMIVFDSILRFKDVKLKNILFGLLIFLLFALPVLIWKFSNSKIDVAYNKEWFYILNKGFLYHIFTMLTFKPLILFLTLSGISGLILFFITKASFINQYNKIITNFIIAAIIIIAIQSIAVLYPLTIIIQSQIIRIGILAMIFSYLYFSHYVSIYISKNNNNNNSKYLLLSGLLLSLTPLIALLTLLLNRVKKINKKMSVFVIVFLFFILIFINYSLNIWQPGIHIFPIKDDLYKAEIWAKKNTPIESVFIVPPTLWWFYNTEWRVISERSIIASFSDILEIAFLPSYTKKWIPRFNMIAPNTLDKFNGDIFNNYKIVSKSYNSLSKQNIINIARKYNASYFISERSNRYDFPVIYQNAKFIIYQLNFPKN